MVKDTDLAWLAGFLDGEGTIGISRTNGKNWKHPYLRPAVQAPNTDRRAIDRMAEIIGAVTGKPPAICVANKGEGNWKKAWRVRVSTQWELLLLLPAIMPYLVLKKRQAELCLDFCKRRLNRTGYHHRWHEFREIDEAAYTECIGLNKRGNDAVEQPPKSALKLIKEA